MKILSIDVGIKNLSVCLFNVDVSLKTNIISKWNNINLGESEEMKCIEIDKNGHCGKPAKFTKDNNCYCLKHSKKQKYIMPCTELNKSYLNKQTIASLEKIAEKYGIHNEKVSKKSLLNSINKFIEDNCFIPVKKSNASKVDLVTIGRNIVDKLDTLLENDILSIDTIIIENQIGPIANKMKTIQGMISQYFIMRNTNIKIEFISACNKLKDFATESIDTEYKERKKMGIQICRQLLKDDSSYSEWEEFFEKHLKKDDLSDCFLQGLWYIKHKICL